MEVNLINRVLIQDFYSSDYEISSNEDELESIIQRIDTDVSKYDSLATKEHSNINYYKRKIADIFTEIEADGEATYEDYYEQIIKYLYYISRAEFLNNFYNDIRDELDAFKEVIQNEETIELNQIIQKL